MANQQIGVNMKFTADTSQAKNQIQTLQTQLTQAITTASKSDFVLNKQLQEAISSAAELKSMLTAATNVNTGNLDLSKFSEGLSRSESSLKDYAKQLIELGPAGEQAFMTLAKSVVSAEVPAKRTSALLNDIFITLKNTAKWQISSNIMHGFEGALKSAYGYAQDLNKSLNNIRIVTSANIDEMARFAEQANKSAKALSTTTTDYTNASLIYYQQGLSDQEVKERTDITIKMANAAGQSAEIVSDQMTAVWNNFDNGSKSLEYYADVMTALGAATASSTDEIATGLEKFAAISETVGLSYEYATAALATVTDKTRQSADVVGTAFKTMFARIEGLELGETLDDGTDLNQYSEALAKVGVNIKEANGQLKDMDDILNGMADVWETLNRDEQVALAQKVAGVRQYNQLISLMENWDAMQDNLAIAQGSEGSLQEQADIYAESWEASRDRVTAAAEDIYTKLLDEDFFIGVNNLLEDALGGFSRLIDVMGGLPGILTSLGSIATRVFGNQIGNSINNLIYNIGVFTGAAEDSANILRNEMKEAIDIFNKGLESGSSKSLEGEVLKQEIDRTYELQTKVSSLTEEQKQYAQELIKIETQYGKNAVAAQQAAEAASQNQGSQARQMRNAVVDQAAGMGSRDGDKLINDFERTQQYMVKTSQSAAKLKLDIEKALTGKISGTTIIKTLEENIKNLDGNSKTLKGTITNVNKAIDDYKKAIKKAGDNTGKKSQATKDLKIALSGLEITEETLHNIIQETAESVKRSHPDMEVRTQDWIECGEAAMDTAKKEENASNAETLYQQRIAETSKKLQQGKLAVQSYGQAFVKGAQGLSSLLFGLNSLKSIFDTLNDEDLSGFEKITTVMTQLTMSIPAIISGFSNLGSAVKLVNETHKTGNASIFAYLLGLKAENLENEKGEKITLRKALANKLETQSTNQNTIAKTINLTIAKLLNLETWKFYAVLLLIVGIIAGVAIGLNKLTQLYNADAIAAEKAKETAKELGEMYDEAADKYQNMIDIMSQYEEAQKSLNELTKGTKEYKEALDEANRAALELIQNNPGKFTEGEDYSWEGDQLTFKPGVLDQAKADAKDQESAAYAAKQYGQAKADSAQAKADQTSFTRQIKDDSGFGTGDMVWKSLLNSLAAFGGGEAGANAAALGQQALLDQSASFDSAVSTVVEAYQNNQNILSGDLAAFTSSMNALGIVDQKVIDALFENKDALQENAKASKNAADNFKLASEAVVRELLGDNKDIQDSANKDAVVDRSTDVQGKAYEAELAKLSEFGKEGTDQGQAWKDYAKEAGLEGTTFKGTSETEDGKILYEYLDANGQILQVSLDAMKEMIATSKANTTTENVASNLVQVADFLDSAIADLSNKGEGDSALAAEGAKAAVLGDFSGFTGEELSTLSTMDPVTYAQQMFGEDWEAQLIEIGFANAEEYMNSFSNGITAAQDIYNNALASLGENSPLKGLAEGASADTVQSLANQATRAEGIGEGYGTDFQQNISDIVGTVDIENQGAALEALAGIDWSQLGASQEAIDALDKLGISSEGTEEKINELKGEMRELNGVNLDDLNTALDPDIDVEEYENLAEHIQDVADESDELSDDLKHNEKAAKKTAEAILRFDKAIQKVNDNYEDWSDTLESGSLQDQAKVVDEMKDAYADMLDLDMDSLSDDFVKDAKNLDLMKQAAEGSEDAYNQLQEAARQDIAAQVGLDDAEFQSKFDNLMGKYYEGQSLEDLEVGANLNDAGFLNELSNMVNAANMTAQEATDYLASMGVDAEVETVTTEEPVKKTVNDLVPEIENVPGEATILAPDGSGTMQTSISVPKVTMKPVPRETEDTVAGGGTSLKVTSANKSSGGGFKYKNSNTGGGTGGKSSGGGGGSSGSSKGSKPQKMKVEKKKADPYKETNDRLEDISRNLKKANKEADYFAGPRRIKALQEVNKQLELENDALQDQIDLATDRIDKGKTDISKMGAGFGVEVEFDENDNITNYKDLMTAAYGELAQAQEHYNTLTAEQQETYEKQVLEPLQDRVDGLEEAISTYEEDVQIKQDAEDKQIENEMEQSSNITKAIDYVVELKTDAADMKLDLLEEALDRIEDKAFSTAEAISQIGEITATHLDEENSKSAAYQKGIKRLMDKNMTKKEKKAYKEGDLDSVDWSKWSQEDLDSLKSYSDGLLQANADMIAMREQVNDNLSEAFDEWAELYEEHLGEFDHLDKVMDSYNNIMDLTGASGGVSKEDRKEYNQIKVDNANRRLASAKEMYTQAQEDDQSVAENLQAAKEKLAKTKEGSSERKAAEEDLKTWEDAYKKSQENLKNAETEFLDSWENSLQVSRDTFLANSELELKDLEQKMAGTYGSIAAMQEEFDRNSEIDDRYLENYEKLYELNKMSRNLEKEINNTASVQAKEKLLKIQEKINHFQEEGVEMSKYDLENLQKQYDLELAKIALEEAQDAKSQVRLTQDAEGNFSYTYGADEEKNAEAQQTYEDKLYEATASNEEYIKEQSSNILSAQQEMLDKMAEINQKAADGLYASDEEYKKALADTQEYYTGLITYYGLEVDKASTNNTLLYAKEYETYAAYADGTMTEMEKLEAQQKAVIAEAAAEVTMLRLQQEASNNHLKTLYDSDQISAQEYMEKKSATNAFFVDEICEKSISGYETTGETLRELYDQGLISEEEYLEQSKDNNLTYNGLISGATQAAREAEAEAAEAAYKEGAISKEEYFKEIRDINDEYTAIELEKSEELRTKQNEQATQDYKDGIIKKDGYLKQIEASNDLHNSTIMTANSNARDIENAAAKTAFDKGDLTAQQYFDKMESNNKHYNEKIEKESKEFQDRQLQEAKTALDQGLTNENDHNKQVADAKVTHNLNVAKANADARDIEKAAIQKAYDEGLINEEQYKKNMADVDADYDKKIQEAMEAAKKTEQEYLKTQRDQGLIDEETYQEGLKKLDDDYSKDIQEIYEGRTGVAQIEADKQKAANASVGEGFADLLPGLEEDHQTASGYAKTMSEEIGSPDDPDSPLGKIASGYDDMEKNIATAMTNAGTSIDGFAKTIKEKFVGENGVKKRSEKTAEALDDVKEKAKALPDTIKAVEDWQKKYSEKLQLAIDNNTAMANGIQTIIDKIAGLTDKEVKVTYKEITVKEPTKEPTKEPKKEPKKETEGDGVPKIGDVVTFTGGTYYEDSYGGGDTGTRGKGLKAVISYINLKGSYPYALTPYNNNEGAYGWVKKDQISGYDTGGYTGEWGPEGRLAILHQKELILNAEDTENMLNTVSMIREIANMIDFSSYQQSLMSGLSMLTANATIAAGIQQSGLQQHIEIFAEFPDATDHSEIELAFQNIVNAASQYANRAY